MTIKPNAILFFATGATAGNIPFAPGTMGTVAGLPLCYLISRFHPGIQVASIVLFAVFAVWISERAEQILGKKDPGRIVIDEMVGIFITLAAMPFTIWTALGGFVLFRFFDILKPFPIRNLERKFSGGIGIVIDDVAAGILAHIVLRISIAMV